MFSKYDMEGPQYNWSFSFCNIKCAEPIGECIAVKAKFIHFRFPLKRFVFTFETIYISNSINSKYLDRSIFKNCPLSFQFNHTKYICCNIALWSSIEMNCIFFSIRYELWHRWPPTNYGIFHKFFFWRLHLICIVLSFITSGAC